ncbi:adenylyltransferase/cytidyltransferase family protein [Deinococcus aerophilus]|uniref:Bifunctional nicotinamide mononucleotide adenylyltransferase/ADP-ribose pyrophosphatase n=1 Tax=Deinococcus aerophilus TaxID=522488 RepID=A0ABQ2GSU8_9DEIO|nr:adenylyltransferase/cytidyltransferase family protein [Deinococcus aerophilus]GGM09030.1 bifunctional nicotinamide mononucleotide adenylyltransferase/ADP-ribose pyrophosphatase [Deinococcus aerophilus]
MTAPDGAVFVGRFQPPHAAHVGSVVQALEHAPRVLVLLGSANLARSVRNPFRASERAAMFRAALRDQGFGSRRVTFRPLPDRFDAARWAGEVRARAAGVFGPAARLALLGFEKDASSAYLDWFPGWTRLRVPEVPGLHATDLRRAVFTGQPLPAHLPAPVADFLQAFLQTPAGVRLQAEWRAVEEARAGLPAGIRLQEERYLFLQDGRVCLNTRTGAIGRGLWELPGQVLPPGERSRTGADAVFDHPARALVAPTTAYVFLGPPPAGVPGQAVSLGTAVARPRRFFEDHHVILTRMLGLD